MPAVSFQIQVKPTYLGQLTFTTDKAAMIEDNAVTLKSVEIDPQSAAVIFCVLDPQGKLWLPGVDLIYRGDVIHNFSAGLLEDARDLKQEMCYRLNYNHSFYLGDGSDPKTDTSVLLTKLTQDQPERLPTEVISRAQNELAAQGIQFDYVIVSHGATIAVTLKPAGLTGMEAMRIVMDALARDSVASGAVLFDLE